jgi:hypothetical protein
MKPNHKNYIKASVLSAATVIEISTILDFCKYIDHHNIKDVFLIENNSKFAVLAHNSLIQINTNAFLTLDDAKNACLNEFPDAGEFYEAQELNISTYPDFQLVKVCGIKDKTLFDEIQSKGFVTGFEKYKAYLQEELQDSDKAIFPDILALFNFAKENHFENFDLFFDAFKAGFENFENYQIALEKGFNNAKDFKTALENGFPNNELYQIAKEDAVETYTELQQKMSLELAYPDLKHDESVLLFLLSKLPQDKKVGLNKLHSLLETAFEEYGNPNSKKVEDWFTRSFEKIEDIAKFLANNENVKKFGTFDVDGEFFEINTIKDRSIVIDGSNVAYNSVSRGDGQKPMIAHLITMVNFLKKKGFIDILIIADASLRHKLGDAERIKELGQIAKYEIAPAATTADVFLISHVKSRHCLLLSNDTFKDHKFSDSWIATNIDYYRLTFMITDGEVFMPDLK